MEFSFGSYILRVVSSGPERQIKEDVERLTQECLVIGQTDDYKTDGILVRAESAYDSKVTYCCVFYGHQTSKPQFIVHPLECNVWLLFDQTLALVALDKPEYIKQVSLPMLYYIAFRIGNNLVVIHELGVCCFDVNADMVWEIVGTDVLRDFKVVDNEIICIFEDGQKKTHDLGK